MSSISSRQLINIMSIDLSLWYDFLCILPTKNVLSQCHKILLQHIIIITLTIVVKTGIFLCHKGKINVVYYVLKQLSSCHDKNSCHRNTTCHSSNQYSALCNIIISWLHRHFNHRHAMEMYFTKTYYIIYLPTVTCKIEKHTCHTTVITSVHVTTLRHKHTQRLCTSTIECGLR